MSNNWAFFWVQIIGHNKAALFSVWALLSLVCSVGLHSLDFQPMLAEIGLLVISLALMCGLVAYLMDSLKVALIQMGMSLYILLMTFGGFGWLSTFINLQLSLESVLGLVVLFTLVTSNLIHVLTSLLREMARGSFQFDAVAEALKLNVNPLFLSNFTTALGFVVAAWFNPEMADLATLVCIGVVFSYLTILTWLPMLLISWLLEFRVGNSSDRHGLTFIADWLLQHPRVVTLLAISSVLAGLILVLYSSYLFSGLKELVIVFALFVLLFTVAWQNLRFALVNVWLNGLALLCSLIILSQWLSFGSDVDVSTGVENEFISLLILMIPLGLIVDDGIHFFSRYLKALNSFHLSPSQAITFAMSSVGRPIWITSCILVVGLSVLVLSQNPLVHTASLLTVIAVVISSLTTLIIAPALLIKISKK